MFERILSLLKQTSSSGQFCTQISTGIDDFKLVVHPNGPLDFPLDEQAEKSLIRYAQPAKFGLGEKTLYDPKVRNVWEIPADRIQIDEIPWSQILGSVLGRVQNELSPDKLLRIFIDGHPCQRLVFIDFQSKLRFKHYESLFSKIM